MYFGQRLLEGEIAYIREYDDKSIVLSAIFSLPAAFKSIKLWTSISILVSLIATYRIFKELKIYIRCQTQFSVNTSGYLSMLGSSLFLFTLATTPYNFNQVNNFSASLIALIISYYLNQNTKSNSYKLTFIAFSLIGAIAISIRPYLILPVSLIGSWIGLRTYLTVGINPKIMNFDNGLKSILTCTLKWNSLLATWLFILNVLPYILLNKFKDLIAGLNIMSIEYVSESSSQTIVTQILTAHKSPLLFVLLIASLIIGIKFIIGNIFKVINQLFKNNLYPNIFSIVYIDYLFLAVVFPISLEYMFLRRHFFDHYFSLFSPFTCIAISLLLAYIMKVHQNIKLDTFHFKNNNLVIILMLCTIGLCFAFSASELKENLIGDVKSSITNRYSKQEMLKDIESIVNTRIPRYSFLVTQNNLAHWKLNESRHGFPHAAVFGRISRKSKSFQEIYKIKTLNDSSFLMPKTEEMCSTLLINAPEITFVPPDSSEQRCLDKYPREFIKVKAKNKNITSYKRRDAK
tara:strand:- start:821 stop:2371 length:1551 start_codon:yes stop_codon:yes gene_type:complete